MINLINNLILKQIQDELYEPAKELVEILQSNWSQLTKEELNQLHLLRTSLKNYEERKMRS